MSDKFKAAANYLGLIVVHHSGVVIPGISVYKVQLPYSQHLPSVWQVLQSLDNRIGDATASYELKEDYAVHATAE